MNISAGMFQLKLKQRSVNRGVSESPPQAIKVTSELTDCPLGNKTQKTIPTILNCGNQCLGPSERRQQIIYMDFDMTAVNAICTCAASQMQSK